MFVSGPFPPRRLALPAPSRTGKAQPAHDVDERGEDRGAALPAKRRGRRRADQPVEPTVDRITSATGVQVQAEFPHPRRGLRADASERTRYARAYDTARSLIQPGPARSWERSA